MNRIRLNWRYSGGMVEVDFDAEPLGRRSCNGKKLFKITGLRGSNLRPAASSHGLDPRLLGDVDFYPDEVQRQIAALVRTTIELPEDHELARLYRILPPGQ